MDSFAFGHRNLACGAQGGLIAAVKEAELLMKHDYIQKTTNTKTNLDVIACSNVLFVFGCT